MNTQRRKEDRCAIVRLWNWATPYIQIVGFIITIGTVIFVGGGKWNDVNASIQDVQSLKSWREQMSGQISVMGQDLHDLHEWYAMDHGKK